MARFLRDICRIGEHCFSRVVSVNDSDNVVSVDDDELLPSVLYLEASCTAHEHLVVDGEFRFDEFAVVRDPPSSDGNYASMKHGSIASRLGNDDSSVRSLVAFEPLDDNVSSKGLQHDVSLFVPFLTGLPILGQGGSVSNNENESMSESTASGEAEEPRAEPKLFGMPVEMFVRGGTTSARHDAYMAEQKADAERRRDEADKERALSKIPIDQGGGQIQGGRLLPKGEVDALYVELTYLRLSGEPWYEKGIALKCLADITVLDGGELCLVIVCPICQERGVHQDRCQMKIRQSNKAFELSARGAGDLVMFDDGFGVKPYKSAGTIEESERFSCSQCGWTARIEKNRVRPDR